MFKRILLVMVIMVWLIGLRGISFADPFDDGKRTDGLPTKVIKQSLP